MSIGNRFVPVFFACVCACLLSLFCTIGYASAENYNVTYSCGDYATGTASYGTATTGASFVPAQNTCIPSQSSASFAGWAVSGTTDIINPNDGPFPWNYEENKTFTATWSCWPNEDGTDCVPGYEIILTKEGCPGLWNPPIPDKLYTIKGRGVYIGPERAQEQLMEYHRTGDPNHPGRNPIQNPSIRFEYDLNVSLYVPTNPITEQSYYVEQPDPVVDVYTFNFSGWNDLDSSGYISQGGKLANINGNTTLFSRYGGGCGNDMPKEPAIAGYTLSWYDANGTKVIKKPCSYNCSLPRTGVLYAKWTPNTYNVVYNKGAHATSGSSNYTDTNGATYDASYTLKSFFETPISDVMSADTGYVFVGWTTDTPANQTITNGVLNNQYTGDTYWKSTSALTLYAAYDCDTNYQWDNGECVPEFTLTYDCGSASGGTWFGGSYIQNHTVTVLSSATNCSVPENKILSGWDCGGTNVELGGTFAITSNTTCTAQWDCASGYVDDGNGNCVVVVCPIILNPNNGTSSANGGASSNNPKTIYSQAGVGAFKVNTSGALSGQMTSSNGLLDQPPITPLGLPVGVEHTFTFNINPPTNPTAEGGAAPYPLTNPDNFVNQRTFVGYYPSRILDSVNPGYINIVLQQNSASQYIDSNGYITTNGNDVAKEIDFCPSTPITWYAQYDCPSVILPYVNLSGYKLERWSALGHSYSMFGQSRTISSLCSSDLDFTAYWTPETYNVVYNKGAHATSGSSNYTDANGATYDSQYVPLSFNSAPINENMSADTGYVFVGWTTDTPANQTITNGVLNNQYTGDTYWKSTSALTLYAAYDCASGYHWEQNVCVPTPKIVNLLWNFENGDLYNGNQNSCTYETGEITSISHQEIPGWTFTGWKVTNWWDHLLNTFTGNFNDWCTYKRTSSGGYGYTGVRCYQLATSTDTPVNTWGVVNDNNGATEKITGIAKCSDQSTTLYNTGNPGTDNGQYCWCQITSYTNPQGIEEQYTDLPWVYAYDFNQDTENVCVDGPNSRGCLDKCALTLKSNNTTFRTALFGQTQ